MGLGLRTSVHRENRKTIKYNNNKNEYMFHVRPTYKMYIMNMFTKITNKTEIICGRFFFALCSYEIFVISAAFTIVLRCA